MPDHIIQHPSPHWNARPAGAEVDVLVLHDTGSTSAAGTLSWLADPRSRVSYHYLVTQDGTVYQCVSERHRAWHAGKAHLHGVPCDVNGRSIGVALVSDGESEYPAAQLRALLWLTLDLLEGWPIPIRNVVGHRDVAVPPGRKQDPGDLFPWDEYITAIVAALGEPGELFEEE